MKYIKTAILIAGMAAATAACTRKPVVPEFSMLSIDTLIGTPANGCKIEFRFATIANAAKSPALRSIEAANAEYFFELEDFGGTARQAVDSAIRQIAAEMLPDSVEQTMGTYEISDLDEHEISRLMVGRDVSLDIEKEEMEPGKTVFSVKDMVYVDQFGKTRLDHVSFSIKEGQILGIAGIDGKSEAKRS